VESIEARLDRIETAIEFLAQELTYIKDRLENVR
jgi:tetrahydromethanopterin S-methyltransferase subunit G